MRNTEELMTYIKETLVDIVEGMAALSVVMLCIAAACMIFA